MVDINKNLEGTGTSATAKKLEGRAMYSFTPGFLAAIRDGDHRAFQRFYLDTVEALVGFVNVIVHSEAEAEDICQQIYVTIWENREGIDPSGNFRGYLYKMAKTAALRSISKRKAADNYVNYRVNDGIDFGESPDELIMTDEMVLLVKIALDNMPEQRRRVFEMSRYDGLDNDEISSRLNITNATVRSHLSHALKELKEIISLATVFLG